MRRFLTAFVLASVLAACSTSGAEQDVTRNDFGKEWPLTVESGTLRCDASSVTFESRGTTYAVNGTAQGRASSEGWTEIDAIWADDPSVPGTKINIGPLLNRGLELCEE